MWVWTTSLLGVSDDQRESLIDAYAESRVEDAVNPVFGVVGTSRWDSAPYRTRCGSDSPGTVIIHRLSRQRGRIDRCSCSD